MISEGLLRSKTVHNMNIFNALHVEEMIVVARLNSYSQPVFVVHIP